LAHVERIVVVFVCFPFANRQKSEIKKLWPHHPPVAENQETSSFCFLFDTTNKTKLMTTICSIFGKKYDLRGFYHPGGARALEEVSLVPDAGNLVRSQHAHNWPTIVSKLKRYELDDSVSQHEGDKCDFDSLRAATKTVFTLLKANKRMSPMRLAIWMLLLAASVSLNVASLWTLNSFLIFAAGISYAVINAKILHEASHLSLGISPGLSTLFGMLACPPIMSFSVWRKRHIRSHHLYTNALATSAPADNFDIDVTAFDTAAYLPVWLRRIVLIPSILIAYVFSSSSIGPCGTLQHMLSRDTPRIERLECFASLSILYAYYSCGRTLHGVYGVLYWMAVFFGTSGFYFGFVSQLSHVPAMVLRWRPTEPDINRDGWLRHQIEHSLNYAVGSSLHDVLSFGLNTQIEHHLFPGVTSHQLHKFAPAVRRWSADRGIIYTCYDGILGASAALFAALRAWE
jgi:fatty acid desaturase